MEYSNFEDTNVVLLPHCELPRESRRSELLVIGGAATSPARAAAAVLQPRLQLAEVHIGTPDGDTNRASTRR